MARQEPQSDQLRLGLRALAHPLRLRMLSLLTGSPFSAAQLSRELGVSQALASYHLRQLHGAGVIELVEERLRRGGRERRFVYRPPVDRSAQPVDDEAHALLAEAIAAELRRRARHAQPGRAQMAVDAELWVSPQDWQAAVDAVRTASLELHAAARPPRSPDTVRVSVSALLFRMVRESGPADGE